MPDQPDLATLLDAIQLYGARRVSNEVVPNDRNAKALGDALTLVLARLNERTRTAYQRGLAEGRRAAVDAILALTEPREDAFRSEAVLTAYAVAAEVANGGPLSAEENALLDLRADSAVRYDLGGKDITHLVQPPGLRRQHDAEPLERCCDLHGRNCEQGGEECCEHCTEAHHFEIGHGGVPCSSPDLSAVQPEDGGR